MARRVRRRRVYRRKRRNPQTQYAYTNPRRKRRRRRRNPGGFAMSPPTRPYRRPPGTLGRRIRRRRGGGFKRNPPTFRAIGPELGWGAVGFMGTKWVGNTVAPMLSGIGGDQPIMRIGIKFAVAYATAWGLETFFGRKVFMPAFIGGSLEAIQDSVKTFISPMFPALAMADEPLGIYLEPGNMLPAPGMGTYLQPELGAHDYEVAV